MKPANIFDAIPAELQTELTEVIAAGEKVRIERIVSQGHSSPDHGWYDEDQHEWVLLLQGEAVLCYASGEEVHLTAGSHVTIAAHTRHKVSWTHPGVKTVWLAVYY